MSSEKQHQKLSDNLAGIDKLLDVMRALRNPDGGCPWDLEQNFETIAPYTIEEAYEVADAIENGNIHEIKEELGDLLLQVVFHSQIAADDGLFEFQEVAEAIADKIISRHPHVFGNKIATDADSVISIWDAAKDQEKQSESVMDHITKGLPALMRAQKIQKKAMKSGFKWNTADAAFDKVNEELDELKKAQSVADKEEEYGDLLFSVALLGRYLKLDAETALRSANNKFIDRFRKLEIIVQQQDIALHDMSEESLLQLWQQAKKEAD